MRNGWMGASVAALVMAFGTSAPALAQSEQAKQFGAREEVQQISLSPDGTRVAFLAPIAGAGRALFVADVAGGSTPRRIMMSDGDPESLTHCRWTAVNRLMCQVYSLVPDGPTMIGFTRMVAVDADGANLKLVMAPESSRALGYAQFGGNVVDWLPDSDGSVLMTRTYIPENSTGTRLASARDGYGVDRVDTRTLARSVVEQPRKDAASFLSDGHGTVRVMTLAGETVGLDSGKRNFMYRLAGERAWKPLSTYDLSTETGFYPVAVDRDLNAVYGFDKLDGRQALFRIALDGTLTRTLVLAHPRVDVDSLVRIGRQNRVVGVSWATEHRNREVFDPKIKSLLASLGKALPGQPGVEVVDASVDENRLLLWAGSDVDPGRYYTFDRKTRQLNEIMLARPPLEKVTLAQVKPITYKAADGTEIPAYLTLPPGSDGKNLPAIVMPHGGPSARDEWGFDWLPQFFAARGYAVLQPNYRGSTGYGDSWYVQNGFKSWKVAIGDVNDAGRWMVSQGIAAPSKLGIVGWSYGGYAALQSAVLDPQLFKAIVAIAPVTDLGMVKTEADGFTNAMLVSKFVGSGPHIAEGSPARHADRFVAPVLLFHGDRDANVGVAQSRTMEARLKAAGKKVELTVFPKLDHQLDDSAVRTQMLDRADTFLRQAMGM